MLNHSNMFPVFNSYNLRTEWKRRVTIHQCPDDAVAAAAADDDDESINGMVMTMITTTMIIFTTPRSSWWSMMIMMITTIMINDHQFVSVNINLSIIVLSSLLQSLLLILLLLLLLLSSSSSSSLLLWLLSLWLILSLWSLLLLFFLLLIIFLAATKQLYEWYFLSVRLSVRLSVCLSVTPFWLCSHHRIIMKFSGVITTDQGNVHAKGQGQRSKVKVTEVTTQIFVSGL